MGVLPERILLATDGSEGAARATRAASDLAGKGGAELHIVHVWHDVRGFAHDFVKRELRRRGQEVLEGQVEKIRAAGGEVAGAHLRGGRTSNQVIALGGEIGAGLLVVGSRGLGTVRRILMGSQSEELAAAIGKLYGAGGLIVYSHPDLPELPPGEARSAVRNLVDMRERDEKMLDDRAGELETLLGCKPEVRLSGDYPAKVLLDASQAVQPSLVAVGSRGRAGIARTRLGSVSTKVVTAAHGPVLVYPHVE